MAHRRLQVRGSSVPVLFENSVQYAAVWNTVVDAARMQQAHEQLEPDDGEDEDGEEHEQADLKQRHHRLQDRLEHHLEACASADHREALFYRSFRSVCKGERQSSRRARSRSSTLQIACTRAIDTCA